MRVIGTLNTATDTTPPSVPQGVAAVAINRGRCDVSWLASTDNVGVAGYQIFRNGSPLTTVDAPATTFSDASCSPSTLYAYGVAAYDAAGNTSQPSGTASATTPANALPSWTAVPDQNLIVGDSQNLNLNTYCVDADEDAIVYTIVSGTLPTGLALVGQAITGTPTVAGESRTVTVRATDPFASVETTIDYVTFDADVTAPPVPPGLAATVISDSQIDLTWNASVDVAGSANEFVSGTQDYRVYRDDQLRATVSVPTTAYSDTGLSASTGYGYRILGRDAELNSSALSAVVNATTQASAADPNPLYPALDMSLVPFHVAAGAYGARVPFQTATPPTIDSFSNASTFAQLEAAMAVPGRRVTVTANITGGNINIPAVTDVEVVVPFGIVLNGIVWGNGFTGTVFNRVRWIKAAGDTIGGQIHNFRILGNGLTNWIIDGLQISGSSGGDNLALYPGISSGAPTRGAILRNRFAAANAIYGYGGTHLLVAGNSGLHDANNTDNQGDWGFRNGAGPASNGPYIYFQNDLRGQRFGKIRFHPSSSGAPYYAYVVGNYLVDRVENRSLDCTDTSLPTAGFPQIDGLWFNDNRIYVSGGAGMGMNRFSGAPTCLYVRMGGNIVNGSSSYLTTGGAPDGLIDGTNVQNAAAGSDPAWQFAGDPTGIDWSP